jgi:ubiquitin-conjugating enzyme E2 R
MDQHRGESASVLRDQDEQNTLLTPLQLINDNVFEWSVALIVVNPDSFYYGGYFKAKLSFPKNYPYSPPGTPRLASLVVPS